MRSSGLPASAGHNDLSSHKTERQARYVDLTQQHQDLDYMINALSDSAGCDELLVARLKKRKLHLKDEITRVADTTQVMGDAAARP